MSGHGPTPGSRCSVCQHPRVHEADDQLRRGKSVASVARFLGMARRDPVDRHRASGHVAPIAPGVALGPAGRANVAGATITTAEAQIRAIVASLDAIDVATLAPAAQMALFAERRRAAESLSRIAMAPPLEIEVDVPGDHPRGVRALFDALAKTLDVAPCVACGTPNGVELRTALHGRMRDSGLIVRMPTREEFYASKGGPPKPPDEVKP